MIAGLLFSVGYIVYFQFLGGKENGYWMDISPQGIGVVGMMLNLIVSAVVSFLTAAPPQKVQEMVEEIRYP